MCVCVCVCVSPWSNICQSSGPCWSKHRSLSETVYWKRFVFWEWETARWTNIDTEPFEVIFGSVVWMCFYREHTHTLSHTHTHTHKITLHLIGKSHLFPFVLQQSSGRAERFLIENRGLVTPFEISAAWIHRSSLLLQVLKHLDSCLGKKKKLASGNDLSLYYELLWNSFLLCFMRKWCKMHEKHGVGAEVWGWNERRSLMQTCRSERERERE